MFKKLLMSALAVGALALNAPAAQADEPTYDCNFRSVMAGAVSQTYEGTAEGYVVHAGDPGATIRCYIEVDGTEVSSTPTGTGVTSGPISYTASDTSRVRICAVVTVTHGGTSSTIVTCYESTSQPIPPDEFWDLLDMLFIDHIDPLVCPGLAAVAGTYGNVTIGSDGDVFIDGEAFYTCPPY